MFLILIFFAPTWASITNKMTANIGNQPSGGSLPNTEDVFEPKIHSEMKKILIYHEHCHIVSRFSLSTNFSTDCYLKYLPIDFSMKTAHGVEKILTAYLDSERNELHENQESSVVCRVIRRYQFKQMCSNI